MFSLIIKMFILTWVNIFACIGVMIVIRKIDVSSFGARRSTTFNKNNNNNYIKDSNQEEVYQEIPNDEYSQVLDKHEETSEVPDNIPVDMGNASESTKEFKRSFAERINKLKAELSTKNSEDFLSDVPGVYEYDEDTEYLPTILSDDDVGEAGVEVISDKYEKMLEERINK